MIKKILIATIFTIIVCFGGYDIYIRIQKSHEPKLVFVDESLRIVSDENVNPFHYVLKATDYKGKDINDKEHLTFTLKSLGKKKMKITYKLDDSKGHSVKKELELKKVKIKKYVPEGEQKGTLNDSDKKLNKVFLFADYDGIAIRAMAEADNYGYESSQNYIVKEVLNDSDELIGYECVFLN